jgi:hypothetical protein
MMPNAWDVAFGLVALLMPLIEAAAMLIGGEFMMADGRARRREEIWWGRR